ncbi:MAG: sulfotransferase family 2 domain-containing protein [Aestuariivirga sp.]|uniref:sulfotransferase family 2 domain-containing protein n=1 Tax=Aestuariivirga sp. TaxID=2650926 RepID=UPI0030169D08
MIVSNTHNFIFLKVSKTGGSSVEAYLRRFCGQGDIVTWLDDDEEQAIKGTGACPPMGFAKPAAGVPPLARLLMAFNHRKTLRRHGLSPHASAARVKHYVGDKEWYGHLKFCVVRNPLDRSVSQFFWTAANRGWEDAATNFHARFDEFLQLNDFRRLNEKGRDVYAIDGRVVADRVLRFETLEQDLGRTMRELGIDTPVVLTRFKSTQRPKGDFAAMLNDRQRQVIRDAFAFDIEQFGYVV